MADTPINGNTTRLGKLAESKVAAAWQRIIVIVGGAIGGPLLVAILIWVAVTLTGLDSEFASIRGIISLQGAELKGELDKAKTELSGEIDKVSQKVDGQEKRVDRLEDRINSGGPR
jgi:hypothetical protein